MPKMTPEQRAELERQLQEDDAADDDDDFEIEIWNGDGDGARLPFRKGKTYLSRFGIDVGEPPAGNGGDNPPGDNGDGTNPPATTGRASRYFGRREAPGKTSTGDLNGQFP